MSSPPVLKYIVMAITIVICCILKNYSLRPWQSIALNIVVLFNAFMITQLLVQDGAQPSSVEMENSVRLEEIFRIFN